MTKHVQELHNYNKISFTVPGLSGILLTYIFYTLKLENDAVICVNNLWLMCLVCLRTYCILIHQDWKKQYILQILILCELLYSLFTAMLHHLHLHDAVIPFANLLSE